MSIATASDLEIAPALPWLIPLVSAAACVALADWLFYGWDVGISLALFLGVLGVVAIAGNRAGAPRHVQIIMAAVFSAGLLALRLNQDQDYFSHSGHWRTCGLRAWRLQRYFANKGWLDQTGSGKG